MDVYQIRHTFLRRAFAFQVLYTSIHTFFTQNGTHGPLAYVYSF